jgi:hypothetical protein
MPEYFQNNPQAYYYFWTMVTVVAIVAIYFIWVRKKTPPTDQK